MAEYASTLVHWRNSSDIIEENYFSHNFTPQYKKTLVSCTIPSSHYINHLVCASYPLVCASYPLVCASYPLVCVSYPIMYRFCILSIIRSYKWPYTNSYTYYLIHFVMLLYIIILIHATHLPSTLDSTHWRVFNPKSCRKCLYYDITGPLCYDVTDPFYYDVTGLFYYDVTDSLYFQWYPRAIVEQ